MSGESQNVPPNGPEAPRGATGLRHALVRVRDVVLAFLPSQLREIVKQGLLKTLLVLATVIVVLPPAIVMLAAFWVKQLNGVDIDAVRSLRASYVRVVQEAFSFEEVAARSNVRLDYFQWLTAEFQPKVKTFKEFRISIQRRQKAQINVQTVTYKANDPSCSIPEEDIELVSVHLGGELIRLLKQVSNSELTIPINDHWWKAHGEKFDPDEPAQRLTFQLTKEAKGLPECGRIFVEGSISVFKDVFPGASAK